MTSADNSTSSAHARLTSELMRAVSPALLELAYEVPRHVRAIGQLLLRESPKAPQTPKLIADRLTDLA